MRHFLAILASVFLALALPQSTAAQSGTQYFLVENGQQAGPFDQNVLMQKAASGQLTANTLVWANGMADWQPAGTVPEVAAILATATQGGGTNQPPTLPETGTGTGTGMDTGTGAGTGTAGNPALDQEELRDYGVPATAQLHTGAMHGKTPNSIPGGQVVTTSGILSMVQAQKQFMVFHVLYSPTGLPGAIAFGDASQAGSFSDQIQQRMKQALQQATQGNTSTHLVFYCQSTECWMSYNASLRAINLGYSNVLWYRGGVEAWQKAGLQLMPIQGMQQQ